MIELSLFTGAGGGVLGTKLLGWQSVGYVEWEPYCQQILAQRIKDGILDEAPIFGDIDDFIKSGAAKKYKGYVDVVTAGFPCQPFSVAGKKKGQDDERNKWPQTIQCIRDVRPRYALLENVPGLLNSGYFGEILSSLAEAGFNARWCVLGADDVGAPHRRKRLWVLAYPNNQRSHGIKPDDSLSKVERRESSIRSEDRVISKMGSSDHKGSGDVADTRSERKECLSTHDKDPQRRTEGGTESCWGGEDVADSDSGSRSEGQSRRAGGELPPESEGLRGRSGEGQTGQVIGSSGEDVADSESESGDGSDDNTRISMGREQVSQSGNRSWSNDVADSERIGQQRSRKPIGSSDTETNQTRQTSRFNDGGEREQGWWDIEPDVGRVANGVASRVDRLKALGNGQVPAVAATAWTILSGGT